MPVSVFRGSSRTLDEASEGPRGGLTPLAIADTVILAFPRPAVRVTCRGRRAHCRVLTGVWLRVQARRFLSRRRVWLLAAWVGTLTGCHARQSPTGPTPPPVQQLSITCPASFEIDDVVGASQAVTYTAPVVTGGVAPVSSTCTTASGADFPIGATPVTCTATQSVGADATCAFTVTLVARPILSATTFMAFGDSITAGEINDYNPGNTCASQPAGRAFAPFDVMPDVAYPADLQGLLAARYTGQTFTVTNNGESGADSTEVLRIVSASIGADPPQVVLLLEGFIDLAESHLDAIPGLISNLDTEISLARSRGVGKVFLSSILPVLERNRGCEASNAEIVAANSEIRALADRDGVFFVDGHAAFTGQESTLLGLDGLHPNQQGYQVLAQTFFDAIRGQLEAAAPSAASRLPLSRPHVKVGAPPNR